MIGGPAGRVRRRRRDRRHRSSAGSPAAALPWAMAGVAALIGLPLFFEVGVVLLVPIVLLVARRVDMPLMRIGIPALAGLSVLHGLVPPHPGPLVAIAALNADLGLTLLFGLHLRDPDRDHRRAGVRRRSSRGTCRRPRRALLPTRRDRRSPVGRSGAGAAGRRPGRRRRRPGHRGRPGRPGAGGAGSAVDEPAGAAPAARPAFGAGRGRPCCCRSCSCCSAPSAS